MNKKVMFVKFVEEMISEFNVTLPEDVAEYWEAFKIVEEKEKPLFTDNGKVMLKYLQDHPEIPMHKAKDIAEGLCVSSRLVSGSMRKLCDDGYVDKVSKDPVVYKITDKGINAIIE